MASLVLMATLPVHAQVTGGPIIDGAVYGNIEFYPGQTAPLLVVVQNDGYLQSLSGTNIQQIQFGLNSLQASNSNDQSSSNSNFQSAENGDSSQASYDSDVSSTDATSEPLDNGTLLNIFNQSTAYETDGGSNSLAGTAEANNVSTSTGTTSSNNNYYIQGTNGGVQENTQNNVPQDATTALGLACQLATGDAPLEIVSGNPAVVGSLQQGQVGGGPTTLYTLSFGLYQPLQFWIRIDENATPGDYILPLVCTYKYLVDEYSYTSPNGQVLVHNKYLECNETISLHIVVMPRVDLAITNVTCTDMVPDTNGYIYMTVENLGNESITQGVAFLMQPTLGPSQDQASSNYPLNYELSSILATSNQQPQQVSQTMVVPLQNSQYVGDLAPGESCNVTFVVSISPDAEESNIPLSVVVSYHDPWDQEKSSNVVTFGVHVEPEMIFTADPPDPIQVRAGGYTVANVSLTNTGSSTADNAVVRINALDPFTVSYDTVYLGNVAPGQTVPAKFGISARADAVPTTYYVTLEVKYYDSHNDPHVTKIVTQDIQVVPPLTIWDTIMQYWWLILLLALLIILGAAYFGYKRLKGKRKTPVTTEKAPGTPGKPTEGTEKPPEAAEKPSVGPEQPSTDSKKPDE